MLTQKQRDVLQSIVDGFPVTAVRNLEIDCSYVQNNRLIPQYIINPMLKKHWLKPEVNELDEQVLEITENGRLVASLEQAMLKV